MRVERAALMVMSMSMIMNMIMSVVMSVVMNMTICLINVSETFAHGLVQI